MGVGSAYGSTHVTAIALTNAVCQYQVVVSEVSFVGVSPSLTCLASPLLPGRCCVASVDSGCQQGLEWYSPLPFNAIHLCTFCPRAGRFRQQQSYLGSCCSLCGVI